MVEEEIRAHLTGRSHTLRLSRIPLHIAAIAALVAGIETPALAADSSLDPATTVGGQLFEATFSRRALRLTCKTA
jgi:hypothetical protein